MSLARPQCLLSFFFFNDTATTEIYTLSLHDALPISRRREVAVREQGPRDPRNEGGPEQRHRVERDARQGGAPEDTRSEEHTSELQSRSDLVCRLLLEKKKQKRNSDHHRAAHRHTGRI